MLQCTTRAPSLELPSPSHAKATPFPWTPWPQELHFHLPHLDDTTPINESRPHKRQGIEHPYCDL